MIFHKENPIAFPKSYENRKFFEKPAGFKILPGQIFNAKNFSVPYNKISILKGR